MALWNQIAHRLGYLGLRARFDRELDDEIRSHIETRADELVQEGLPRAEALERARREFGSTLRAGEESRAAWQFRWFEDLATDLRHAARLFRRSPSFAFAAIACLAIGIGANTTVFSVAMEALFSHPSCREPESLVEVAIGGNQWAPMPQYRFLRDAQVFDGLAGMNIGTVANWRDGNTTCKLAGTRVTGNFFQVAGVPLAMGRPILPGELDTAVLTHSFWLRRLGGDPNVLGRKLLLDGSPYTVVGVLPREHRMLAGFGFTPDLYLPTDSVEVVLYGRLPLGVSRQAAYGRLLAACREMDRVHPDANRKWAKGVKLSAVDGTERLLQQGDLTMPIAAFFSMLVIVTGLVLLIACANVSSLLLARSFSRSHELAIRISLGGSRGRLIRQLLAESLLLALCGTAAGLVLNLWLTRLVSAVRIPTPLPIELLVQPGSRLLLYSALISVLVTLLAGLAPAVRGTRGVSNALKEHEWQVRPGRWTLRNALVAAQLALSILLLSAGLVFLRNLLHASSFNAGFDAAHTLFASAPRDKAAVALERVREIPGVEAASLAAVVPLNPFLVFFRNGGAVEPDTRRTPVTVRYNFNAVGPDYFRVTGIPILHGRPFLETDSEKSPRVVILNENLARLLFGDVDPVGHRLRLPDKRDATVVGVARNSRYVTLGERNALALYAAWEQRGAGYATHMIIRGRAPEALIGPVRAALGDLDPAVAVEAGTMSQMLWWALMPSRAAAIVLGTMAALGLALASVGLYGVLLYAVARRVREIGLRVALGATPARVLRMVAADSGLLVAVGLVIGLGLSVFAVRPLAMFLVPGVNPADPMNFVLVACGLALVAALATLAPTLRALSIDPAVALRHE
jgi:predicted permease